MVLRDQTTLLEVQCHPSHSTWQLSTARRVGKALGHWQACVIRCATRKNNSFIYVLV